MRSTLALTLLATAGFAAAQQQYRIDPSSVSKATREYWCTMSKTQCPLICLQQPNVKTSNTINNDCDADDLTYSCVCDDNVAPNITMYTQTMPYFICQEWGTQCQKKCSDNTCADKCTADHPCGAVTPFKGNATASPSASGTASATQSGSGGADSTGIAPAFGDGGDDNTPERNAASTLTTIGSSCGMALTFVGVLAGAALL